MIDAAGTKFEILRERPSRSGVTLFSANSERLLAEHFCRSPAMTCGDVQPLWST